MFGPLFSREAFTAPRHPRFYAIRTFFVAGVLGIILAVWQLLVGSQDIRNPGDLARFGAAAFGVVSPLLLTVAVVFSALFAAAAVSQEKDRKTLLLLLLTDLTNRELVLGKLMASMLTVLVAIAATAPLLMMLTLVGGVAPPQVLRVLAVTTLGALAAGSLGSMLALWREKTFQALALSALGLAIWFTGWEMVAGGVAGPVVAGVPCERLAVIMSPWRAIQVAAAPSYGQAAGSLAEAGSASGAIGGFCVSAAAVIGLLNGVAILLVRVWNPSRETRQATPQDEEPDSEAVQQAIAATGERPAQMHAAGGRVRRVWDNPVLWRELCTWAYGRRVLVVKLGYVAIFAAATAAAVAASSDQQAARQPIPPAVAALAPLLVVSVVLVGAVSVTSFTGERDVKALDLLLATDLSPQELIFGKLGGAIYNAKEMILLPLALVVYFWWSGGLSGVQLVMLLVGLLSIDAFAAMLGLHAGMMYPNSRHAIAASLGTLLFLFLGVSTAMRMMLAVSDSFQTQLVTFFAASLGGGLVLFSVLASRNPSPAMGLACFFAPFAIFYAITSFLLGQHGLVFLATVATFGFGTAAMLVPALAEFDVATGRTTAKD